MLSLFGGVFSCIGGVLMLLVGFRIFKISGKKEEDKEKIDIFFKKYGLWIKIGGLFCLITGLVNIFL
ncbi:MAG: hypothetical protein WCI48_05055 [Bacteroidota bacterium]